MNEDEIASWGAQTYKFEDLDSAVKSLLDEGTDAVVMGYVSALQNIDQNPVKLKQLANIYLIFH